MFFDVPGYLSQRWSALSEVVSTVLQRSVMLLYQMVTNDNTCIHSIVHYAHALMRIVLLLDSSHRAMGTNGNASRSIYNG